MPEFSFISADQHGRTKKSDNKLVRSVCMRGKNQKPDSRRSKKRAKHGTLPKPQKSQSSSSPETDEGIIVEEDQVLDAVKIQNVATANTMCSPTMEMYMRNSSLITFLDKVDGRSKQIILKYMTYSISENLLYPVERALDFHRVKIYWSEFVNQEQAFLTSSLLTASAINDHVMQQPPSILTIKHLRDALKYLNSQISQLNARNFFSVMFTVITLGNMAAMFGDYSAASMHIRGLERIVSMQGGKEYLRDFPKFHFKINRLDLSRSLSTGKDPLFRPPSICPPLSWQPFFAGSNPLPSHIASTLDIPSAIFPKFTVVYNDLRFLANLINEKIATDTVMSTDIFHGAIHSVQVRLLDLAGNLEDDIAECLRLGMLAFLTTTFQLPGRKLEYTHLAQRLKDMLTRVHTSTLGAQRMMSWVLMISTIAIFETDEPWIPRAWNMFVEEGLTWGELRSTLKGAIWIECIHDAPAEKVFLKLDMQRSKPVVIESDNGVGIL